MIKDQRATRLAHNLVTFSLDVQPGERVLIETRGIDLPFVADLIREVYAAGGQPFLSIKYPYLDRELMLGCTQEQLDLLYRLEADRMHEMDCYIGIRLPENAFEENGVPYEKVDLYNQRYEMKLLMEDDAAIAPTFFQTRSWVCKDNVTGIVRNGVGLRCDFKWADIAG